MNQPLSAHLQELERRLGGRRLPLIIVIVLVIIIGLPSLFYPLRPRPGHSCLCGGLVAGRPTAVPGCLGSERAIDLYPPSVDHCRFRPDGVGHPLARSGLADCDQLAHLPHRQTSIVQRRFDVSRLLLPAWSISPLISGIQATGKAFYSLSYYWLWIYTTGRVYCRRRADKDSSWILFFCGLFVAITPWFKQTSLIFVAAIFLWMTADVLGDEKKSLRLWLERIIPFGAGVLDLFLDHDLIPSQPGDAHAMLEVLRYSISAYPNYGPLNEISDFGWVTYQWVRQKGLLVPLFFAGLVIILLRRDRRHSWLGFVILVSAGLIGVYAQRRLWEYHWVSTLPFMAIIAAAAAVVLVNQLFKPARSVQKWVIVAFALALVLVLALSKPLLEHSSRWICPTAALLRWWAGC